MMQVTGEEGISLEDYVKWQKSVLLDMVYLQQDAFDDVDASMPRERQPESFHFLKDLIDSEYDFADRDAGARLLHPADEPLQELELQRFGFTGLRALPLRDDAASRPTPDPSRRGDGGRVARAGEPRERGVRPCRTKKREDKKDKKQKKNNGNDAEANGKPGKMPRKEFEKELRKLQTELCHLQEWVKKKGLRVVVVFEGRDAAGKGGVIKRITERVSPRVFRVVATPAPSDRAEDPALHAALHPALPGGGRGHAVRPQLVQPRRRRARHGLLHPGRVRALPAARARASSRTWSTTGIILIKYFFDVSQEVQEERFQARITDPMRHWKLSPMDVESWRRWWDYTAAYARA